MISGSRQEFSSAQKHAAIDDADVFGLPAEIQQIILQECDISQLGCLFLRYRQANRQAAHQIRTAAQRPKLLITSNLPELSNPKMLKVIRFLYKRATLVGENANQYYADRCP